MITLVKIYLTLVLLLHTAFAENANYRRLYSVFPFMGEFDYLEMKMRETPRENVRFIVTEGTRTFDNVVRSRPLPLEGLLMACKRRDRHEKWLHIARRILPGHEISVPGAVYICNNRHRIVLNIIDHLPDVPINGKDDFKIEDAQLLARVIALRSQGVTDNDLVLLSDVDELVKGTVLDRFMLEGSPELNYLDSKPTSIVGSYIFLVAHYVFSFRWIKREQYPRPTLFLLRHLEQHLLVNKKHWRQGEISVPSGGWHCTWCFGPTLENAIYKMRLKITTSSHQQWNIDEFKTDRYLTNVMKNGGDIYNRKNEIPLRVFAPNAKLESWAPRALIEAPHLSYFLGTFLTNVTLYYPIAS